MPCAATVSRKVSRTTLSGAVGPTGLSFGLIGFFLWVAENVATYFGAWQYPHQLKVWRVVAPAKATSWAMLIIVAFVLVAAWRARRGQLSTIGVPASTP